MQKGMIGLSCSNKLGKGKTMDTMEKHTVELKSDCTCTNEDGTPSTDCFDCWQDSVWLFKDLMNTWRKTVGVDWNTVRITGRNMNWDKVSGEAVVSFDKVLDTLKINGDFTLRFKQEGTVLTATRSSHDEYCAGFSFTLIKDEDED
jgi:hypothetical protein